MKMWLTLLVSLFGVTFGEDWAVLVAASFEYDNYRHQSDVCHAFHLLKSRGIPGANIIVMLYDDVATDSGNPFPGTLYNTPSGVNVYDGCTADYTRDDVSSSNFLGVISGDASSVPHGKPVLGSTSEDNVFVFYADHGASGFLAFPASHLYANDLNAALVQGHNKGLWRKLVFYVEACEAGSMFDQVLDPSIGVYVVTASNPTESSWGVNCPPDDWAHGRPLGTCLGDLFAVSWMNDTESSVAGETLEVQFEAARDRVALGTGGLYPHTSHVTQYGDLSITEDAISDYFGTSETSNRADTLAASGVVNVRDIPLHLAYYRHLRADKNNLKERRAAAMDLHKQLTAQLAADDLFLSWAAAVTGDTELAEELVVAAPNGPATVCGECCRTVHELYRERCGGYTGYSIQYARLVSNLCVYTGDDGAGLGAKLVNDCVGGALPQMV